MRIDYKRIIAVVLLVLLAAISYFIIGDIAGDPQRNADIIKSIDEKSKTVLALTGAVTVASTVVTLLPNDIGTPIADELAELTDDFLLILVILLAERYLLSIVGISSFKIIIPIACGLLIVGVLSRGQGVKKLAYKVGVFGLAIFFAIPISIRASDVVYNTYKENIDETIVAAEQYTNEEDNYQQQDEGFLSNLIGSVVDKTKDLAKKPAALLTKYIESLAILIVTSCVIPIVVLVFFFWLLKIIIGVDIPMPIPPRPAKAMRKAMAPPEEV